MRTTPTYFVAPISEVFTCFQCVLRSPHQDLYTKCLCVHGIPSIPPFHPVVPYLCQSPRAEAALY